MRQSKLKIEESVFTTVSRLAARHNAVNLGQGFPDFDMDQTLPDLVSAAMKNGLNQYAPAAGVVALKERIAEKSNSLYGCNIDPHKEICVTPGATYAIFTALTTLLRPGDEVIVFEPAYDSYIPNILINGATPVAIPLSIPDFSIDWDRVRSAITSRTKMIVVNSPHNPSGMVLSADDMRILEEIVLGNNLYLLSDEVYEHIIFDGLQFESVLKYPELYRRSFVTYSFGKTYHCTGWKTGYCIAPEHLMNEYKNVHQYNAFSSFSPVQYALAEYLKNKEAYLSLSALFQPKRDLLRGYLTAAGFKALPSHGTYFQVFDYSGVDKEDEFSFATTLIEKAGIAAIPLSPFYLDRRNQSLLRFCFAKKDATIREAGEKIQRFLN